MDQIVNESVKPSLRLPKSLKVEPRLNKLLLYEAGGYSKCYTWDKDKKAVDSFGTLMFVLPTAHAGGKWTENSSLTRACLQAHRRFGFPGMLSLSGILKSASKGKPVHDLNLPWSVLKIPDMLREGLSTDPQLSFRGTGCALCGPRKHLRRCKRRLVQHSLCGLLCGL